MTQSAQEIFDKVVNHLRQQNAKSLAYNPDGSIKTMHGSEVCLYRTDDGKKCAAGILIPDEEYSSRMEGVSIDELVNSYEFLFELKPNISLLLELQHIHDTFKVHNWENEFKILADEKHLTYTALP